MGCAIHFFEIQPFIVTLAGMFFARGMCTFISDSSISITDGFWTSMSQQRIGDPAGNFVSISVLIAFAVVLDRGVRAARTPGSAATCTRSAATSSRRC